MAQNCPITPEFLRGLEADKIVDHIVRQMEIGGCSKPTEREAILMRDAALETLKMMESQRT
jgi:hypothetical protein